MSNWKDVLRSQHEELGRVDDASIEDLDEAQINADIDRILRRPPLTSNFVSKAVKSSFALANELEASTRNLEIASGATNSTSLGSSTGPTIESVDAQFDGEILLANSPAGSNRNTPRDRERRLSSGNRPTSGRAGVTEAQLAENLPPDSQARFLQAKVKMLTKQNDETNELRRELKEQCSDLQRQLKTEREENKNLKKRYLLALSIVVHGHSVFVL